MASASSQSFYGPASTRAENWARWCLSAEEVVHVETALGAAQIVEVDAAECVDVDMGHDVEETGAAAAASSASTRAADFDVLLWYGDAAGIARTRGIGHKKANAWLKAERAAATPDQFVDLTEKYDWPAYIAHHAEAERIIGSGVCRFGFLLMSDVRDPSVKEEGPRGDFIVLRSDNTAVRLHPHGGGGSKKKEAQPIFGLLQHWLPRAGPPSLDAGAGADPHIVTRALAAAVPVIDRISHKMASAVLSELAGVLQVRERAEPVLDWKWWRFLAIYSAAAQDIIFGEHGATNMLVRAEDTHPTPAIATKQTSAHGVPDT